MVASLAVYLVFGSSIPTTYKMVFPEIEDWVGGDILILDARKDLSALGYCSIELLHGQDRNRICIVKGEPVRGSERFWPVAFIGSSQLQGVVGGHPGADQSSDRSHLFNAVVDKGKFKVLGRSRRVQQPNYCVPFDEPAGITRFDDTWWPNYVWVQNRKLDSRNVLAGSAIIRGVQVANVSYFPAQAPDPGFLDEPPVSTAALIKVGYFYRLLQRQVINLGSADITEILWADRSGWLVVKAVDGERSGLAWLYPQE